MIRCQGGVGVPYPKVTPAMRYNDKQDVKSFKQTLAKIAMRWLFTRFKCQEIWNFINLYQNKRNWVKYSHINLTALYSVHCTVHGVTIKISSYQSSWHAYLQLFSSENVKTFFLLRLSISEFKSYSFVLSNDSYKFSLCKFVLFLHYVLSQSIQHYILDIAPLSAHWITFTKHSA
jgi:hypothetical protein